MSAGITGFIIGLFVGDAIGIFIMCLCQSAKGRDDMEDDDDFH